MGILQLWLSSSLMHSMSLELPILWALELLQFWLCGGHKRWLDLIILQGADDLYSEGFNGKYC